MAKFHRVGVVELIFFRGGDLNIYFSRRSPGDYWKAVISSSDAIRVSRVFCIFFMSYVHLHFYGLSVYGSDVYMVIRIIFVEVLGRSSVPLLSIISGFLAWGFFQKNKMGEIFNKRARKILLPMIIWNLLGTAMIALKAGVVGELDFINSIFSLSGPGAYTHLEFLRDIYVMTLLTPVLIYLARLFPLVLLSAAVFVFACDLDIYILFLGVRYFSSTFLGFF